jgi:hypothetical protein
VRACYVHHHPSGEESCASDVSALVCLNAWTKQLWENLHLILLKNDDETRNWIPIVIPPFFFSCYLSEYCDDGKRRMLEVNPITTHHCSRVWDINLMIFVLIWILVWAVEVTGGVAVENVRHLAVPVAVPVTSRRKSAASTRAPSTASSCSVSKQQQNSNRVLGRWWCCCCSSCTTA